MIKYHKTCRNCGHDLLSFLNLGEQHIQGSFIYKDKLLPPKRTFDSTVMFCSVREGGCGLVQNKISLSPEILYSNYGYRSSVSNTMKLHLNELVDNIIKEFKDHNIRINSVLDIGANDLFTLKCFPKNIHRVGIDPSDIILSVDKENIEIVNKCFPCEENFPIKICDVITSIACFYDIENPINFVLGIEKILSKTGVWVVEFAYLPLILERLAYDEFCLEHINLYSIATFEHVLNKSGLKIFKALTNNVNGGSIQLWITHSDNILFDSNKNKENILSLKIKELDMQLDDFSTYLKFSDKVSHHKNLIIEMVNKIKQQGKTIHILGASTKLNTLLQFCEIGPETIEFASERSLEKVGAKTISGIKIISEEESRSMKPDYYFVGPYHFMKEILSREKDMITAGTSFIFPLPELLVINKENYNNYV